MIPVMLAARKLDVEDPNIIYWLRITYGSVQAIVLLLVLYVYIIASSACKGMDQIVYVPPAAQVSRHELVFPSCSLIGFHVLVNH